MEVYDLTGLDSNQLARSIADNSALIQSLAGQLRMFAVPAQRDAVRDAARALELRKVVVDDTLVPLYELLGAFTEVTTSLREVPLHSGPKRTIPCSRLSVEMTLAMQKCPLYHEYAVPNFLHNHISFAAFAWPRETFGVPGLTKTTQYGVQGPPLSAPARDEWESPFRCWTAVRRAYA